MDWNGLHCRFLTATQQDTAPFEEPCVEWDYSRYARALGLTAAPGLHDLDHEALAVAVLERTRWAEARQRMERWAREADWNYVGVSAWPNVVVPDPVTYGIGVGVAGPDAPLWFRAGQQGRPAAHRRRSAASSLPFAPCERWLIAADRVRRRVRSAMAEQGQLIVVEHAEMLTPSAMGMLHHFVHAQAAWKARMLTFPAPCFVVLLVSPEHEAQVRDDVDRFPFQGDPFVWRLEGPGRKRQANLSQLSFEEEQIVGTLVQMPALLTKKECLELFGKSSERHLESLTERGVLKKTNPRTQTIYEPEASWCDLAAATESFSFDRSSRLLRASYIRRYRREGRQSHLRCAQELLALASDREELAEVRLSYGLPQLLPMSWSRTLLARSRARTAQGAIGRFMILTSRRDHRLAATLAQRIQGYPVRSEHEAVRVFLSALSCGRAHGDRAEIAAIWRGLVGLGSVATLVDAMCVLGDFYFRLRTMRPDEIAQRMDVLGRGLLADAIESASRDESVHALQLVAARVRLSLFNRDADECWIDGREALLTERMLPAYAVSTYVFALGQRNGVQRSRTSAVGDICEALGLTAVTGNLSDKAIQLSNLLICVGKRPGNLFARPVADAQLLTLYDLQARLADRMVSFYRTFSTPRTEGFAASSSVRPNSDGDAVAIGRISLVRSSLASKDMATARDAVQSFNLLELTDPALVCGLTVMKVEYLIESFRWDEVPSAADLLTQYQGVVGESRARGMARLLEGVTALLSNRDSLAVEALSAASESLGTGADGVFHYVQMRAIRLTLVGRMLRESRSQTLRAHVQGILRVIEDNELGPSAGWFVFALQSFDWRASGRSDADYLLESVAQLRGVVDPGFRGETSVCAEIAKRVPAAFRVLQDVVASHARPVNPFCDAVTSVESSLDAITSIQNVGRESPTLPSDQCAGAMNRRQLKGLCRRWVEGASPFWASLGSGESPLTVYGYFGDSRRPMRVRFTPQDVGRAPVTALRWVGESSSMKAAFDTATRAYEAGLSVLITGESGVGKRQLARVVQRDSSWIELDAATVPSDLLGSHLFGHVRGAFTGAHSSVDGVLAAANGKTLFIRGIDDLSERAQVMLLRALEEGFIRPIGSRTSRPASFRVVATAREDVDESRRAGRLRDDLYFRVAQVRIDLLPLHERPEDVTALARHFLRAIQKGADPGVFSFLQRTRLDGNARELRNVLVQATLGRPRASLADVAQVLGGGESGSEGAWLDALQRLPQVFTAKQFASAASLSLRSAQRRVSELMAKGLLELRGAGRATRYEKI